MVNKSKFATTKRVSYFRFLNTMLFVTVLLLGFFLRAQETISGNYLFLLDQGRDMMDVKKIVFDHKFTLIGPYTSLTGVFQGPLYYYLLAAATFVLKGNPIGAMMLMLAISISVIGVVFFFMKKFFGTVAASVSAFLFAVSPEAIAAATYFWNPHPMWLVIVLYIFIFYKALTDKKYISLLLPIIALCFHFQTAFGVFLLLATFLVLVLFYRNLLRIKYFLFGILLSLVVVSPQILFDVRHDFLMTNSVLKIFQGSDQGLFVGKENAGYSQLAISHLDAFRINFNSAFVQEKDFVSVPKIVFVALILLTPIFFIRNIFSSKEKKFVLLLLSLIGVIIALSFFYPFPIRYWFLTGFQSVYLLLFGIVLAKCWQTKLGKVFVLSFVVVGLWWSVGKLQTLYSLPRDEGGASKINGKLAAIDYIYRDAKEETFGVLVFTPAVLTDAYDYLLFWYGKEKYGYVPHKEKKGLVYLLMEPDSGKPWSYKGWQETVVKTGKVIESKTLPSGLIVEKRIFD